MDSRAVAFSMLESRAVEDFADLYSHESENLNTLREKRPNTFEIARAAFKAGWGYGFIYAQQIEDAAKED